jgi:hypothetical protein
MTKAKKGTGVKKANTGFSGFAGVVNSEVPKVVTRPLYFVLGCFAGKGIAMLSDKILKPAAVPADGLAWKGGAWKESLKALAAPIVSVGLGGAAAYYGNKYAKSTDQTEKMLGEIGEFAGYGLAITGVVSGVKKAYPKAAKYLPSLGEAEFDGTTQTPESKEEVAKSLAILKAAADRDAGFKGTELAEKPSAEEIAEKAALGLGWVEGMGWVSGAGVGRLENANWNNRWGGRNEALLSRESFKDAANLSSVAAAEEEVVYA